MRIKVYVPIIIGFLFVWMPSSVCAPQSLTSDNQATTQSESENISQAKAKSYKIATSESPVGETANDKPSDEKTIKKGTTGSEARALSDWVQSGWDQMAHNNIDAAMANWQEGVNQLPSEKLLAFLGVYSRRSAAEKELKRIGATEKALMLYSGFKGKHAYFILSAQHVPANKVMRHEKLKTLYQVMHSPVTIFANAAGKFQTAVAASAAAVATEMPSNVEKSATPSAESVAEQQQVSSAKLTIPATRIESGDKNLADPKIVAESELIGYPSTAWVEEGWKQLGENDMPAALASWQLGINNLPSDHLLAYIGVYVQLSAALKELKRGGVSEKLIIVHSAFKGKKAYYVLSARDVPTDKSNRREKLASLYQAMDISGVIYANAAKKFQTNALITERTTSSDKGETFAIGAFDIIGNTLVSDDMIQNSIKAYLGENKNRNDLIAAKQAILKLYRNAGYDMVAVGLPHHIHTETISIRVFEVSIGKIWVSGETKSSIKSIKASFPELKSGTVARAAVLEEQLKAISLKKNIQSAKLIYHPNNEGVIDIEIQVDEKDPLKVGIMTSSLGTQESGRALFTGIVHHNNVWNAGHELTVSYTGSEKIKNLRLYSVKYDIPVESFDGRLTFKFSRGDVASGQILGVLDSRGDGTLKSVHYEQTFFRTNTSRHYIDAGYEQHLFHDRFLNVAIPVSFSVGVLATPIVLGYGYESSGEYGQFGIDVDYYHNTPIGTKKRDATYQLINPAALANWSLYRLRANYSYDWKNNWSFSGKFRGQLSNSALIGGERLYISGMSKVRGFEEAEASGDTAFFLRTELITPDWLPDTRFLAFVDAGRYKLNFPFPGEFGSDKLVSAGLGVHWTPGFGLDALLEAGIVLNGMPVAPNGSIVGHFNVLYWLK